MMALPGVELLTLVSEPDALTTRPPPPHFKVAWRSVIKWKFCDLFQALYFIQKSQNLFSIICKQTQHTF